MPEPQAIYIHVPFCLKKCAYCDFNSYAACSKELQTQYFRALLQDLEHSAILWRELYPQWQGLLHSVYIGGGTPTVLPAAWYVQLLEALAQHFRMSEAEISIEANPGTVSLEYLQTLRAAGINRLSFGVQSFDNQVLKTIGRIHTAQEACQALQLAGRAGFSNVSLDLIYGLPGQTLSSFARTLQQAFALEPQHLSCYALSLEEGTRLTEWVSSGRLTLPEEDECCAMEEELRVQASLAGFERYEVSNWSRPHFQCRHNLVYWRNEPYYALGCGAVCYLVGWRSKRIADPLAYCQRIMEGGSAIVSSERLSREEVLKETIMLGLRMSTGLRLTPLAASFALRPEDLMAFVDTLPQELWQLVGDRLVLTSRGLEISNEIFLRLWDYHFFIDLNPKA